MTTRSPTIRLVAAELRRRGHSLEWITTHVARATVYGHPWWVHWSRFGLNDTATAKIVCDKPLAARLMRSAGVSVPTGKLYKTTQKSGALAYAASVWPDPVVIKPARSRGKGRGCTTGITHRAEFDAAWREATRYAGSMGILVQREFVGREARFHLVGGRVVSVLEKIPAPDGRFVGEGVRYRQIIDQVHPTYIAALERAASIWPGLRSTGADVRAVSFEHDGPYVVIELNPASGLWGHHHPHEGQPVDVASHIVDAIETEVRARYGLD